VHRGYSRKDLARAADELCAHASACGTPDLGRLAESLRVQEIRLQPMLPSGCLRPVPGGFVLSVRSDRQLVVHPPASPPDLDHRQRFTLAHELAHTLFYDLDANPPVPRPRTPTGGRLEGLCHFVAGRMLLPEPLLQERLRKCERVGSHLVLALSREFRLSPEAVVRRLADADQGPELDCGVVLVESGGHREADRVRATFFCKPLAIQLLSRPRTILPLESWLHRTLPPKLATRLWESNLWRSPFPPVTVRWGDKRLTVRQRPCSTSQYFLEFYLPDADDPHTVELYDDTTLPLWRNTR
jgi:hypothetical protein